MQKVQRKTFINKSDEEINEFLNNLPAEDIVSTHFAVYGYENAADEWTTIFYKVDVE
ncbi:hypothetical protein MKX33_00770 [Paenibacillus sp. FSL R5-0490]|uniref:hypothetical protein n=1 Tax=Paenibacillus sp. FSL R5-0490 TaxID=1920424 RepID=UPI0030CC9D8F